MGSDRLLFLQGSPVTWALKVVYSKDLIGQSTLGCLFRSRPLTLSEPPAQDKVFRSLTHALEFLHRVIAYLTSNDAG